MTKSDYELRMEGKDQAVIFEGMTIFKSPEEIGCFLPSLDQATLRRLAEINSKHLANNTGDTITRLKTDYQKHQLLNYFIKAELEFREEEQTEPDRLDQFNNVMKCLFVAVMDRTTRENWINARQEFNSLDQEGLDSTQQERLNNAINVVKRASPEF